MTLAAVATYPREQLYQEIAYIAYHFHWSRRRHPRHGASGTPCLVAARSLVSTARSTTPATLRTEHCHANCDRPQIIRAPGIYQTVVYPVVTPAAAGRGHPGRRVRGALAQGPDERADAGSPAGTSSSRSSATPIATTCRTRCTASSRTAAPRRGSCGSRTSRRAARWRTSTHASCAEHVQIDDWNKPSLRSARSTRASWGNNIWFKCVHTRPARPRC